MNQSPVDHLATELKACWNYGASIETIESLEHQLFDAIVFTSQQTIPENLVMELETISPQSLFYDPENENFRILLQIEELL